MIITTGNITILCSTTRTDSLVGTEVVEPLNRFETDILSTTGQAVRPIDAVASPAVGLLLDTFHMHMEEGDAVAAIPSAGDRLVHFMTI